MCDARIEVINCFYNPVKVGLIMPIIYKLLLVMLALCQLGGLSFLFLGIVGFGSLDQQTASTGDESNENDNCHQPLQHNGSGTTPAPEKVVLIVIDALRVDMMTPKNFPFLLGNAKHRNTGLFKYNVTVDSPTVTLPRVKTLITGRSPTYLDILRNFQTTDNAYASNRLNQENVISSLRKCQPDRNICFFGDETWLRLFPIEGNGEGISKSKYFHKSEGVTSFFVKDFYEVDTNVTRNLDDIDDCHFLILHYLGLDHIGHVFGPTERPDLIRKKLIEMDNVVKKLHSKWTLNENKKSVLIITGDHGMANSGGHGGSSYEEITTPLYALTSGTEHLKNDKPPSRASVNQIDIAPTLSSLLGLKNIPNESTGQLILEIIQSFQTSQDLTSSYQRNCEHLLKKLGDSREASTYKLWLSEISKMGQPLSIKKYIELENQLSGTLRSLKSEGSSSFSLSFTLGFLIITISEIFILIYFLNNVSEAWEWKESSIFLSFFPPMILYFSSSFVEEEHYVRYFIFSGIILFLYCSSFPTDFISFEKLIKILFYHRLVMNFNQTGDKWSQLKDLNDTVNEYHLAWGSALIGIFFIYRFNIHSNRISVPFKITLAFIYFSKAVESFSSQLGAFIFGIIAEHHIQKIAFGFILLSGIFTLRKFDAKTGCFTTILLIFLNLQRLPNFIVTGLTLSILQEIILLFHHQHILKTEVIGAANKRSQILTQVALIWFAHSVFFYQGNSNGLASIDVSTGYIGFGSFSSSFLIGFLIYFHTYGGPIIVYLHFLTITKTSTKPESIEENGSTKDKKLLKSMQNLITNPLPLLMLLSNGAEAVVYATTLIIHRNHLFIWSVFVPKLMYLIAQSVMYLMLSLVYLIL